MVFLDNGGSIENVWSLEDLDGSIVTSQLLELLFNFCFVGFQGSQQLLSQQVSEELFTGFTIKQVLDFVLSSLLSSLSITISLSILDQQSKSAPLSIVLAHMEQFMQLIWLLHIFNLAKLLANSDKLLVVLEEGLFTLRSQAGVLGPRPLSEHLVHLLFEVDWLDCFLLALLCSSHGDVSLRLLVAQLLSESVGLWFVLVECGSSWFWSLVLGLKLGSSGCSDLFDEA